MLIQPRINDKSVVSFHYDVVGRALAWSDKGIRAVAMDCDAMAHQLFLYLYSYRQSENVNTKPRFWKLYLAFYSGLERLHNMPRQNTSKRETAQKQGELQFLTLRLTEEQFAELDTLKASPAQIMTALSIVIESGIGFSMSYNKDRETANATFMDKRDESVCRMTALSAFGSDVPDALKILLYKHSNVLGGDWSSLVGQAPATSRRG